ncbi:DUF6221 family protein [Micromonospora sp. NPDC005113]
MDDLVTWLRVQLDDDERVATGSESSDAALRWSLKLPGYGSWIQDGNGDTVVYDEGAPSESEAEHITRHDPARVLAEVDAKRRIVDLFEYEQIDVSLPGGPPATVPGRRPATAGPVLRLLALPYADRPGYRDEWRP